MAKTIRTVKHIRGPVGKIVKWLFIGFNLLMVFWLFSYWGDIAPMMNDGSSAAQAGAAIGSTIGTGMILMIWVLGAIVLGIPVLLTKGKRVEIEETPEGSTPTPASQDSVHISQEAVQKQAETQPSGSDDWSTKLKTGFETLVRYAVFAVCFLIGLALLSSGSAVLGIGFTLLGLIFLPQIKQAMAEKNFNKPAIKIVAVVGIIGLLTYIGTSDSPSRKMANLQENAAQAQAKQADLKEEAEKTFAENPDKVLQDISTYAENKNWWMVKTKTELLLGTDHPEIKKLHDQAVAELAKQEEEKRKQEAERQKAAEKARLVNSWSVNRSQSKMDDTASISVAKEAKNSVQAWLKQVTPVLVIRCRENTTDVIFNAQSSFTPVYGEYDKASIRYRIDDKKAVSQYWGESTDNDAAFAPNAISLLRQMKDAEMLRIEFNPFNSNPATVEFDLRGLRPHLEEVAKTCHWSL
ncbi:MAG: hypothetical protein H6855_02525 [Rhodospirillales bacterium]|nr:hypothetical protein [Rhodospirillales bacterium]MCB9973736.1 hypothetical protein [Rhodospirillales bacterium]